MTERYLVHDYPTSMIKHNQDLIEKGLVTDHVGTCIDCLLPTVWLVKSTELCVLCKKKQDKEKQA